MSDGTNARGGVEREQTPDDINKAEGGSSLASSMKSRVEEFASTEKSEGARHVANFGRAVDRAAAELETSSPELAKYAHEMASKVGRASDALKSRNLSDLYNDANGFARREPVAFFGVALAAGFALTRFLQSSAHPAEPRQQQGEQSSEAPTSRGTNL